MFKSIEEPSDGHSSTKGASIITKETKPPDDDAADESGANQELTGKSEEIKKGKNENLESATQRSQGDQRPKSIKTTDPKHQGGGSASRQAEKNDITAALLSEAEERGFQDPINLPRDAKLISLLIKAEGIIDYEPKIIPQLLEFMHSKHFTLCSDSILNNVHAEYAFDMLRDAQVYAEHANNKGITLDDLRMSVEARTSHSFTIPPCREV